ncbi:MAG: TonB-dependent receptor [Terriglobia bacterium]
MKILCRGRSFAVIAVILLLLSSAPQLFAQAATGAAAQISGSVSDPTGAVVPGAQVKATQMSTGYTRTAVTGPEGVYVLSNLAIGPYDLRVSGLGFKTYLQKGIVLQVNNNLTVNIALELGEVSQIVNVSANASMVQTTSTSVSQVIDANSVVDLPLNGRDPTQLILLSGGAVMAAYGDLKGSKNYPSSQQISVAGGQANGTAYVMDGGMHMDVGWNSNLPLPFPDALQEFSVQTSTIPAQYGGSAGAVVNAVTKSGTNRIHGDMFEFLRNGALNARNFFAAKTDTLKRNQFGGTIGGPVIKDKLFYFAGYQGSRIRTAPTTGTNFVPNATMLSGDFSTLESSACGKSRQLKDPTTGLPFANNFIDPSRFNSSALAMVQKYIPTTSDPCGKLLLANPSPQDEDQIVGRVDWTESTRNNVFGRYFLADLRNPAVFGGNLLLTTRSGVLDRVQSMVLGDTYSISTSLVNSLHLTWTRDRVNRGPASDLPGAQSLGLNIAPSPGNFPQISISGYFSVSCGTCSHANIHRNTGQVVDDVSWIHGRHQIGFGGEYARLQMNNRFATPATGAYSFNGTSTRDALVDFLLGLPISFSQGGEQEYYARENRLGLYAQDSFRAGPHLSIVAGLRWEPYFPEYDINGRAAYFDLGLFTSGVRSQRFVNAPPGVLFPGDKLARYGVIPKSIIRRKLSDFSPRVGFAWDPTGSGRWSVRASYGMFYDLPDMAFWEKFGSDVPWGDNISISSPPGGFSDPYAGVPGGNPFPLPAPPPTDVFFPKGAVLAVNPLKLSPPYTQQWNVSVQRQVGANWLLSASYMGNKSTHRWTSNELDPAVYIPGTCGASPCSTTGNTQSRRFLSLLDPVGGSLISTLPVGDDGANAQYNALFVTANHRVSQNFSILANYTWSHCISESQFNSEAGGPSWQNPRDRNAERGNCIMDVRQLFNLSYLLTSPHFTGPITSKLLGNWQLGGIIGKRTGNWLTATDGQDISLTAVGLDRPNAVGDPHLSNPTLQKWFNTSAFTKQATGTYGNAGTYTILGPGAFTFDTDISRAFKIREDQRLEVRFEAFNWLNHAVFNSPGTTLSSASSYGKILSANDPRILQFAMKYVF